MTVVPLHYSANTALGRFGIANLVDSPDPFVSSMPAADLVNPLTGVPTAGPLAVLVDHAAGLVNHYRRAADEWTVSSELSLELTPSALSV
ncbi:MAG: phenylacetic acid degradation protein, partial [Mycobacterium sp.]